MLSNNPLSEISEGATKGVLEWSLEKISTFIKRLMNKELGFIGEPKTIELVREQYRSGEAKFYKGYISDKDVLFLVKMGLTLRKLEELNQEERRINLRDKIFKKYSIEGLHIAEFVQNNTLNKYVGILLDELNSIEKLKEEIGEILRNIEKYTLFVQGTDQKKELVKNIEIKIRANSPRIFIIVGVKSAAKIVSECTNLFKEIMKEYEFQSWSDGKKEVLFFRRVLKKI